jgi:hypothetical protein
MFKKSILIFNFSFLFYSFNFSKELVLDATSQVRQTKFIIKTGEAIFVEKYQNINGKITENFLINDVATPKEEYFKKFSSVQEEEKSLQKEIEANKKREEEKKRQELALQKIKEEEDFKKQIQAQAFKKLINIELEKVNDCFLKLDKYKINEYFVYNQDTFSNVQALQETKIDLINQAKELIALSDDKLNVEELKNILQKLEDVPDKVERFSKSSIKFAINQCTDTKKLKELLALI